MLASSRLRQVEGNGQFSALRFASFVVAVSCAMGIFKSECTGGGGGEKED